MKNRSRPHLPDRLSATIPATEISEGASEMSETSFQSSEPGSETLKPNLPVRVAGSLQLRSRAGLRNFGAKRSSVVELLRTLVLERRNLTSNDFHHRKIIIASLIGLRVSDDFSSGGTPLEVVLSLGFGKTLAIAWSLI